MRIGADGSWMRWRMTGLGRYSGGLLHAVESLLADRQLVVYYNARGGARLFAAPVTERFIRLPNRTLWNQLRLPAALRADRVDVFLAPATVVPWATGCPTVSVIHDCLAFRQPDAKPGNEGHYWRAWTRVAARRSARVITDSESTAMDITRFTGVPRTHIDIVPPGVDPRFLEPPTTVALASARDLLTAKGVAGRFALQVAGGDRHKGAAVAAAAVRSLAAETGGLTLVLTGASSLQHGEAGPGIAWLGAVPDDVLRALYELCAVVCVASEHEGFGLPVLEAMAAQRPVVSTTAGALVEVGGDVPLYAETGNAASLASALKSALSLQDGELEDRLQRGHERALSFRWSSAATTVLDIIDQVVQQPAPP